MNLIFRLRTHPKIPHYVYADTPKSEKAQHLKHFWSQALWIRNTEPFNGDCLYETLLK